LGFGLWIFAGFVAHDTITNASTDAITGATQFALWLYALGVVWIGAAILHVHIEGRRKVLLWMAWGYAFLASLYVFFAPPELKPDIEGAWGDAIAASWGLWVVVAPMVMLGDSIGNAFANGPRLNNPPVVSSRWASPLNSGFHNILED